MVFFVSLHVILTEILIEHFLFSCPPSRQHTSKIIALFVTASTSMLGRNLANARSSTKKGDQRPQRVKVVSELGIVVLLLFDSRTRRRRFYSLISPRVPRSLYDSVLCASRRRFRCRGHRPPLRPASAAPRQSRSPLQTTPTPRPPLRLIDEDRPDNGRRPPQYSIVLET